MDICNREAIIRYHGLSREAKLVQAGLRSLIMRMVLRSAVITKRILDILGALAGLILLSPFMIGAALAIKLEDGGPIFYKQIRVGKWGIPFEIIKFRSMRLDADKMKDELLEGNETDGLTFKMKKDPRVTRVGRLIRKGSIDEMPQFLNVLRGDMSMVGPRPPVPREVALYGAHERRRLEITPGITCIWQVSGRSNIPFDKQVLLDIRYIRERTIWNDIELLFKTIPAVLFGKGAY
jgi:lipopolysaccharide/colanic/teichoic acid biosynthesis glycosyltransferase